jgi:negative regulator of flagellin synthesis FlgM
MKVDSNRPPESQGPNRTGLQKAAAPTAQEKAAQAPKPAPADKVDISGRGREAADIAAAANQLPDVREAKVREIKQAVESGTYRVDPMKVAESILKEL